MNSKNAINHDEGDKKHEQENISRAIRIIVTCVSVGAVLVWLLGVSTSGLFNFFADAPGFQLYPFFVCACAGIWYLAFQIALRLKNVAWIFMVASAICCFAFVVTARLVDGKIARLAESERNALLGQLTLSPGPVIHETQPFGTLLTLNNLGSKTLKDVRFMGWYHESEGRMRPFVMVFKGLKSIDELPQERPKDISLEAIPGIPAEFEGITTVDIEVIFKADGFDWNFTNRFQFLVLKNEGKYVWTRDGGGERIEQMVETVKRLWGPHNFFKIAPFIWIEPVNVSLDYSRNPMFPLNLRYSIQNGGGGRATNILANWSIFSRTEYTAYTFIDPGPGRTVLPNEPIKDGFHFPLPPLGSAFQRIMTNESFWVGLITYNDDFGHSYQETIKVFHTNEEFRVRCYSFAVDGMPYIQWRPSTNNTVRPGGNINAKAK